MAKECREPFHAQYKQQRGERRPSSKSFGRTEIFGSVPIVSDGNPSRGDEPHNLSNDTRGESQSSHHIFNITPFLVVESLAKIEFEGNRCRFLMM